MNQTIKENIERRARLEHGGDFTKAAESYFRDHPDHYEVRGVEKQAKEDAGYIDRLMQTQIEKVMARDKVDLATATAKVCAEQPDLYKRQRAASSVTVGARVRD